MFRFEDLRVYKEAQDFVMFVYLLTSKWPSTERFGVTDQLRRAALSVVLNIAEVTSRTKKDFCRFLDMARGSVFECVAIFQFALTQRLIAEKEYEDAYNKCTEISKKLSALKSSLR